MMGLLVCAGGVHAGKKSKQNKQKRTDSSRSSTTAVIKVPTVKGAESESATGGTSGQTMSAAVAASVAAAAASSSSSSSSAAPATTIAAAISQHVATAPQLRAGIHVAAAPMTRADFDGLPLISRNQAIASLRTFLEQAAARITGWTSVSYFNTDAQLAVLRQAYASVGSGYRQAVAGALAGTLAQLRGDVPAYFGPHAAADQTPASATSNHGTLLSFSAANLGALAALAPAIAAQSASAASAASSVFTSHAPITLTAPNSLVAAAASSSSSSSAASAALVAPPVLLSLVSGVSPAHTTALRFARVVRDLPFTYSVTLQQASAALYARVHRGASDVSAVTIALAGLTDDDIGSATSTIVSPIVLDLNHLPDDAAVFGQIRAAEAAQSTSTIATSLPVPTATPIAALSLSQLPVSVYGSDDDTPTTTASAVPPQPLAPTSAAAAASSSSPVLQTTSTSTSTAAAWAASLEHDMTSGLSSSTGSSSANSPSAALSSTPFSDSYHVPLNSSPTAPVTVTTASTAASSTSGSSASTGATDLRGLRAALQSLGAVISGDQRAVDWSADGSMVSSRVGAMPDVGFRFTDRHIGRLRQALERGTVEFTTVGGDGDSVDTQLSTRSLSALLGGLDASTLALQLPIFNIPQSSGSGGSYVDAARATYGLGNIAHAWPVDVVNALRREYSATLDSSLRLEPLVRPLTTMAAEAAAAASAFSPPPTLPPPVPLVPATTIVATSSTSTPAHTDSALTLSLLPSTSNGSPTAGGTTTSPAGGVVTLLPLGTAATSGDSSPSAPGVPITVSNVALPDVSLTPVPMIDPPTPFALPTATTPIHTTSLGLSSSPMGNALSAAAGSPPAMTPLPVATTIATSAVHTSSLASLFNPFPGTSSTSATGASGTTSSSPLTPMALPLSTASASSLASTSNASGVVALPTTSLVEFLFAARGATTQGTGWTGHFYWVPSEVQIVLDISNDLVRRGLLAYDAADQALASAATLTAAYPYFFSDTAAAQAAQPARVADRAPSAEVVTELGTRLAAMNAALREERLDNDARVPFLTTVQYMISGGSQRLFVEAAEQGDLQELFGVIRPGRGRLLNLGNMNANWRRLFFGPAGAPAATVVAPAVNEAYRTQLANHAAIARLIARVQAENAAAAAAAAASAPLATAVPAAASTASTSTSSSSSATSSSSSTSSLSMWNASVGLGGLPLMVPAAAAAAAASGSAASSAATETAARIGRMQPLMNTVVVAIFGDHAVWPVGRRRTGVGRITSPIALNPSGAVPWDASMANHLRTMMRNVEQLLVGDGGQTWTVFLSWAADLAATDDASLQGMFERTRANATVNLVVPSIITAVAADSVRAMMTYFRPELTPAAVAAAAANVNAIMAANNAMPVVSSTGVLPLFVAQQPVPQHVGVNPHVAAAAVGASVNSGPAPHQQPPANNNVAVPPTVVPHQPLAAVNAPGNGGGGGMGNAPLAQPLPLPAVPAAAAAAVPLALPPVAPTFWQTHVLKLRNLFIGAAVFAGLVKKAEEAVEEKRAKEGRAPAHN